MLASAASRRRHCRALRLLGARGAAGDRAGLPDAGRARRAGPGRGAARGGRRSDRARRGRSEAVERFFDQRVRSWSGCRRSHRSRSTNPPTGSTERSRQDTSGVAVLCRRASAAARHGNRPQSRDGSGRACRRDGARRRAAPASCRRARARVGPEDLAKAAGGMRCSPRPSSASPAESLDAGGGRRRGRRA
jgi:hypothetical protein